MKYTVMIHGERMEVEFEETTPGILRASIGGRTYTLEGRCIQPGVYWFNWNNRSIEVAITPNGDGYIASIAHHQIPIEVLDTRTALRKAAQHGQAGVAEIRAPMPGKIVRILLPEGSAVQVNQGILVMEAMKMQNEIKSPKNGILRKFDVTEGMAVNAGDVVATVE